MAISNSILTNPSSMTALRTLNGIQRDMTVTQNRVSTGLKVTGAVDDADMAKESAKLTSLQVQQQLSTQTLGIANQRPESLLGLFNLGPLRLRMLNHRRI